MTATPINFDADALRVRQHIANGKTKLAVDDAKDANRHYNTAQSESPLLEAYGARIEDMLRQNLTVEARSLIDVVRARFPGARRMSELIVGIDLGTTNSEIAAVRGGEVRVLGPGDTRILPSCVGISPAGESFVGQAARNQLALYPERTVRSIKRKMGTEEKVPLA